MIVKATIVFPRQRMRSHRSHQISMHVNCARFSSQRSAANPKGRGAFMRFD